VLRFVRRSLIANMRRAVMTAIAVVIGVAMISGSLIFTDTIRAAFRDVFVSVTKGAAVVVSSRQDITSPINAPATLPGSLLTHIRHLDGVAAAEGQVQDVATIVGSGGRIVKTTALPTLALSYVPSPFNGLRFIGGVPPSGPDQVVIDAATARHQGYRVGDFVPIATAQPARRFRISGIAALGSGSGGGATFVVFDLPTAQAVYGKPGRIDTIYVAAAPGAHPTTLLHEIRPLLGPEIVARTARAQVGADTSRIDSQLSILTGGLLAFGLLAALVGAFVIFNTLSITITQRMREFSLLRAMGALRRQVLSAVLVEASVVGVIGSGIGLGVGVLAAIGIRKLFSAVGFHLPTTALVLEARTVLIAVGVGVLVTLVAGLVPAVRAMRAAPLESLRVGAALAARGGSRPRLRGLLAALLAGGGLALILTSSGDSSSRLRQSAIGVLPLILAVLIASPLLVRLLAGVVSWPIERRHDIVSRLARENALRNPSRTAVSASSLMIGLAVVLFVTIYASGLRAGTRQIIRQTFIGDITIQNQNGQSSIPAGSAQAAASAPGVIAVSSLKSAEVHVHGAGKVTATGLDPNTIGGLYRFQWVDGSDQTLSGLGLDQMLVERDTAAAAHLVVGDRVELTTDTGLRGSMLVAGIYSDRALLRGVSLSTPAFDRLFHQPRLADVFVKLGPDTSVASAQSAINQSLSAFPGVVARSEHELADKVASRVNAILILFYALLALSVLMSLVGIINTLTLSVHERARELGMLRAMGMTQLQTRVMVRNEGLITATIGTLVGVGVGILIAWAITQALSTEGVLFSPPWLQVVAVFAVGLLAGFAAAVPPARRAARLDILTAIAHE
jgi:putative ABC transport system permease protein